MFLHLIDCKTAKAVGLKRYFTGNPCSNGSIHERRVRNGSCLCEVCHLKEKQRAKKYRDANKAQISERQKEWRKNNPEKAKEATKRWRKNNIEHVREYEKEYKANLSDEALDKRRADQREYYNRNSEKIIQYQKKYGQENKEKIAIRRKKYEAQNKDHLREYRSSYRSENMERIRTQHKEYYERNRDHISTYKQGWHKKNKNKILERVKRWVVENPDKARRIGSKRRAAERKAIPLWYRELDDFVLSEAYNLCKLREESTALSWQVDHMIPLQARNVCGLHVWNNFQVIPAPINYSKKNRLIYTEPHEWLHDIPKFFLVAQDLQAV